jgi:hypothetical protein
VRVFSEWCFQGRKEGLQDFKGPTAGDQGEGVHLAVHFRWAGRRCNEPESARWDVGADHGQRRKLAPGSSVLFFVRSLA